MSTNERLAAAKARIHKATPAHDDVLHCSVCGWRIKRVPGGQGSTYVHEATGTVAAPTPRAWRELYQWLGEQALRATAEQSEEAVNLDVSVGPGYMAEAWIMTREKMRAADPSLPFVQVIDNDIVM